MKHPEGTIAFRPFAHGWKYQVAYLKKVGERFQPFGLNHQPIPMEGDIFTDAEIQEMGLVIFPPCAPTSAPSISASSSKPTSPKTKKTSAKRSKPKTQPRGKGR